MTDNKKRGAMDLPFLSLVILLTIIGLIMLFSASYLEGMSQKRNPSPLYFAGPQAMYAAIGFAAMILISYVPYQFFRSKPIVTAAIVGSVGLLALVPLIGTKHNTDAKRWLDFGFISFQPSELAKLGVIITLAALMTHWAGKMSGKGSGTLRGWAFSSLKYGVLPYILIVLPIVGLLAIQPHFSAAVIILSITAVMMVVGGTHWFWYTSVGAMAFPIVTYVTTHWAAVSAMLSERMVKRINIWLDPFADPRGDGYQVVQSFLALGSGGFLGLGPGESRQKYPYLPEQYNDFIFAVIGEEHGFFGAMIVIALFIILITRGFNIARHSRDTFGNLLVVGIITQVAVQTFYNVGVVTGLLPPTGISLPFFSHGGTSLMILLAEMGIVLSVSRQVPVS